MWKVKIVTILSLLLLITSACGKNEHDGGPSSLVKSYTSMEELTSEAEVIAEVKVDSQETITQLNVPFTISLVTIKSTIKGAFKEGDKIKIIETGGDFIPVDNTGKKLKETRMKFNGIDVLNKHDHAVLFLQEFVGPQVEGAYVPIGVYQGKFKVVNEMLIQQAPESEKIKDYKPLRIDSFKEKVNKELHEK
ncbi:hypothetical protein FHS16_004917 [Paenibacillus endophyticus]|uniref:Lipoprotein n=1 Tax=Paenibacillus endophyticus TaxID=1294268 RepID=A0A7W5CBX2_9BACL|nr:hypothetical protein [Paenibacillus endophyticus]MBB3154835.1 hypothetical protein [Paenibacillus endophyticus]